MRYLLFTVCLLLPGLSNAQNPSATPTYDELKTRMERFETRLNDWPKLSDMAEPTESSLSLKRG